MVIIRSFEKHHILGERRQDAVYMRTIFIPRVRISGETGDGHVYLLQALVYSVGQIISLGR